MCLIPDLPITPPEEESEELEDSLYDKADEKRRLKKIELKELKARQHEESVKLLSSIFKDMFKYM